MSYLLAITISGFAGWRLYQWWRYGVPEGVAEAALLIGTFFLGFTLWIFLQ